MTEPTAKFILGEWVKAKIRSLRNSFSKATLSSAEAIGIGLHEVSWGEGGVQGATGRRKKEEKASAGYCAVLTSF